MNPKDALRASNDLSVEKAGAAHTKKDIIIPAFEEVLDQGRALTTAGRTIIVHDDTLVKFERRHMENYCTENENMNARGVKSPAKELVSKEL